MQFSPLRARPPRSTRSLAICAGVALAAAAVAGGCSGKKKKAEPAAKPAPTNPAMTTPSVPPPSLPPPTPDHDLPPAIAAGAKEAQQKLVEGQAPPLAEGTECRLFSAEEATAVVGAPVAAPKPNRAGCSWRATEGTGMLAVDVRSSSDWAAAEMIHKSPQRLPVIAEQAFYGELGGHHVFAIVNGRLLQVSLIGAPGDAAKARLIDAAAKIATRVPK